MDSDYNKVVEQLDAKIPREAVRTRQGGAGRYFDYLEGHYVIARLNDIFGQGRWGYEATEVRNVFSGEIKQRDGSKFSCSYIATVNLWARVADGNITNFTDVGYGDGTDSANPGKAHELAAKEAVTDAMKRAAKNLGMSMGLALYDKDQPNVEDAEKPAKIVAAAKPKKVTASPEATGTDKSDDNLRSEITNLARVIDLKKIKDLTTIRDDMKTKYKVLTMAQMSSAQLAEFLAELKTIEKGENK